MINAIIANYKIISVLGEGGMGSVYLAEHIHVGKKAAIKSLHKRLLSNEQIKSRFLNEAKTMATLKHPNIVEMYDYEENEAGCFLIMEYVEGIPLDEFIIRESGPIPTENAIKIFSGMLKGFAYAHKKKIVHRDVKPSNIIISRDFQTVKILDFGIAKILDENNRNLTKDGTQMGTVYYMSPEQVRGEALDKLSDIYSLGVTLFQMLTGINPYAKYNTELDIYLEITKEPLANVQSIYQFASEDLNAIIQHATQKNKADRFQTCEEFLEAINQIGNNDYKRPVKPITNPEIEVDEINEGVTIPVWQNKNVIMGTVAALLIVLGGGYFFTRDNAQGETTSDTISIAEAPVISKERYEVKPNKKKKSLNEISVRGSSLPSLSAKIKEESERILGINPYLYPVDVKLDLSSRKFSCRFEERPSPSNLIKLGLYFGPEDVGCESCNSVMQNNPGSVIFASINQNGFDAQVIGIYDSSIK
jgi:serine/threonine protein kinase